MNLKMEKENILLNKYKAVEEGKGREIFNEFFKGWTTINQVKEKIKYKRFATASKYAKIFFELNYLEKENKPFTTKNGRILPVVTQMKGTIKPYLEYLESKEIKLNKNEIKFLRNLFEFPEVRKMVLIKEEDNVLEGIENIILIFLQLEKAYEKEFGDLDIEEKIRELLKEWRDNKLVKNPIDKIKETIKDIKEDENIEGYIPATKFFLILAMMYFSHKNIFRNLERLLPEPFYSAKMFVDRQYSKIRF